jgi:hypothetical protein
LDADCLSAPAAATETAPDRWKLLGTRVPGLAGLRRIVESLHSLLGNSWRQDPAACLAFENLLSVRPEYFPGRLSS